MHNNEMLLRRKGRVVLQDAAATASPSTAPAALAQLATLAHELERLGHRMGPQLVAHLSQLDEAGLAEAADALLALLRKRMGAHVQWTPMYPGFPQQVMQLSDAQLYWSAFLHYQSDGLWRPNFADGHTDQRPVLARPERFAFMRPIELGEPADFERIFKQLAGARSSLSAEDQTDLRTLVQQLGLRVYELLPPRFVSRENLAILAAALLRMNPARGEAFAHAQLQTATDALRLAVAWCGGDASLAAATRFVAMPRTVRRLLLAIIEASPARAPDMQRRPERFKRLGEVLHVGEFAKRYPQAAQAFAGIRAGERVATFNREVETSLAAGALRQSLACLAQRPGEFARRLDTLLRRAQTAADLKSGNAGAATVNAATVLAEFDAKADGVSTAVLLQVMAHFSGRASILDVNAAEKPVRAFFPKGQVAKVFALRDARADIAAAHCHAVVASCEAALVRRFAALPPLGRCHLDPQLANYLVPFSQRSASKALRTLVRGSRIAVPAAHTQRLFLWWKNGGKGRVDIDLSAALYDANCQYVDTLSYYQLSSWGAVHSGDLVDGGEGAAEFIDLDVAVLRTRGVRYVVVCVNSYTQQSFCDLPECFAGWMARQAPGSGEIFEPATVADRVDLGSDSTIALPMVLDLQAQQMIWADIALTQFPSWNNVRNNLSGVGLMLRALTQLIKPNLYRLFALHVQARGEWVGTADEADTVFGLERGITPFDLDRIRADFM